MSTATIPDPAQMADEAEKERAQLESEAREIDILVKQTTGEIEKLQQRQGDIAGRLRQLKLLFEEGLLTDDFYDQKVAECEEAR